MPPWLFYRQNQTFPASFRPRPVTRGKPPAPGPAVPLIHSRWSRTRSPGRITPLRPEYPPGSCSRSCCASGRWTAPWLDTVRHRSGPGESGGSGLGFGKRLAAVPHLSRGTDRSRVILASTGRSSNSNGTAAEKGLPERPRIKVFPRLASSVGIPGFMAMP